MCAMINTKFYRKFNDFLIKIKVVVVTMSDERILHTICNISFKINKINFKSEADFGYNIRNNDNMHRSHQNNALFDMQLVVSKTTSSNT